MLTDWNYRSILIELSKRGYRKAEPIGVERETSTLLAKVLGVLWQKGITTENIAKEMNLPWEEVETLIFDLAGRNHSRPSSPNLHVIK